MENYDIALTKISDTELNEKINVVAQLSAATAMALSTSYCMERQNLNLSNGEIIYERFGGNANCHDIEWFQIHKIGRPINDDIKSCFVALQKILHSCAIPNTRLLFLITGDDKQFNLYMGIQTLGQINNKASQNTVKEISSFANACWPGLKASVVDNISDSKISSYINNRFSHAYAFTGIPSMDLQKTNYPATVEYLLGGCKPKGNIAYLVVANPINEEETNNIIWMCDEMKGQAESFEKFSLTESFQKGESEAYTKTITETIGSSESEGTSASKSDVTKKLVIAGFGIAAAALFPPAAALGGPVAAGGVGIGMSEALIGAGLLSSLIPTHSKNTSTNKSHGESTGETHTMSESYTKSLGQTVVNGHIQTITEQLKLHGDRYREGKAKGLWNVGCYLFTDEENVTSQLQLKSLLSGDSSRLEPIRVHDISKFVTNRRLEVVPFVTPPALYVVNATDKEIFEHPLGRGFSELTTYLTTDELTSMINFPLHSVPGISVIDPAPQFRLDIPSASNMDKPIHIGNLMYQNEEIDIPCRFNLDNLTRHSLICGANGSGKTNTVLSILNAMNEHQKNFMVIEPAKTEYVDWAIDFNDQLKKDQQAGRRLDEKPIVIYMPGKDSYWHKGKDGKAKEYILKDLLKLNPFEPVCLNDAKPNVQAHMDRIKSIFALAFPMEDILPTVMESLIRDVYTNGEKWLNRPKNEPAPELYPTLGLLSCRIKPVIMNLGYEQRVTGNIYAAINLRLSNLLSGWKRELLNNEVLGGYKKLSKDEIENNIKRPTWDEFFNRRVVVNLAGVSDDADRTFVMGLLLLYLYEYRIAASENPDFDFNQNQLKHLMVVEEAHRVMMSNPNQDSPQYKCGLLFSHLLSEIRAYGQGIMVVDQIPSRLISDAIKNTNTKIIHKLLAADDIEMVADAMGVNREQRKIIPKLSIGQAIVAGINTGDASVCSEEDIYWVKMCKYK